MNMTTETTYISTKDTAKLVRAALKKSFPGVKFSVKSKTYSGGSSIDIHWTDGPRSPDVEKVAKRFEGADFDGMIDLKIYNTNWMLPDGTVELAHRPSTNGSISEFVSDAPHPDAVQVHFMADFVFCNRHITDYDNKFEMAEKMIRERCVIVDDQFGGNWVDVLGRGMVRDMGEGEELEAAFKRVVLREK